MGVALALYSGFLLLLLIEFNCGDGVNFQTVDVHAARDLLNHSHIFLDVRSENLSRPLYYWMHVTF